MEIVTETTIPKTLTQSENTDSECKNPTSDQEPEISGAGEGLLKAPESPEQIGKVNSGSQTPATPGLKVPKNGTPDRGETSRRSRNQLGNSNSDCKTATPDEQTDEKTRILVPKNGSTDRVKVPPKSPNPAGKATCECKTPTPVKQTGQKPRFSSTPDRLKVPKAFKYPERYTSPTDLMMSPITKGLLARTRKGGGRGCAFAFH